MKGSRQGNGGILKSSEARIVSAILGKNVERKSGLKWVFALESSVEPMLAFAIGVMSCGNHQRLVYGK